MNQQPSTLRTAVILAGLTVALGGTVAVSWLAFGGTAAWNGPVRALQENWPLIYGGQALFAGVVGFVAAPFLANTFGRRGAVLALLAAWIGEFVALFVGGRVLANELVPELAWFFWLMATGGPLQPLAALVGVWLARRRRRPLQAPIAESRSILPS